MQRHVSAKCTCALIMRMPVLNRLCWRCPHSLTSVATCKSLMPQTLCLRSEHTLGI